MELNKKIVIRTGMFNNHSSMENYFKNCMIPLGEKLKNRGFDVVFNSHKEIKGYKNIPMFFKNRNGFMHIIGIIFDEIQLLIYRLFSKLINNEDVLYINMNQLLPSILNCKNSIIIMHDIIPLEFPQHWKKLSIYYKYLLSLTCKKIRHIISVSDTTKNKIIKYYEIPSEKITTIYNGIKFSENLMEIEKNRNGYIYVGADMPHKNLEWLYEALLHLKEDESFTFIGACCKNEKLIKLAKCKKNVKLAGLVNSEELKNYYKRSKALVYPSLAEGFGLPLVEAMFYKLNIIVNDKEYSREVCSSYPTIFFNDNDKGNIIEILNNYDKYDKSNKIMNYDNSLITKKYNWDKSINELSLLIERV